MLKIVHISDFHLEKEEPVPRKVELIRNLINDLEEQNFVDNETIILFTGDMIDKGGRDFENSNKNEKAFHCFEERFISPILNKFSHVAGLKDRIFAVPGNHDMMHSADSRIVAEDIRRKLTERDKVNRFFDGEHNKYAHHQMQPFKNWAYTFYDKHPYGKYDCFHSTFIVPVNNKSIGITCVNSSFLCLESEDDKGNLVVGEEKIFNSSKTIENCDFKILLTHHPLEYLKEFEKNIVTKIIHRNYNIHFSGHTHMQDTISYTRMYSDNVHISAIAHASIGKNVEDEAYRNGYAVYMVDFKSKKIHVHSRKYLNDDSKFVYYLEYGTNGVHSFNFSTNHQPEVRGVQSDGGKKEPDLKKLIDDVISWQRLYYMSKGGKKDLLTKALNACMEIIKTSYDRPWQPCRIALAIPQSTGKFFIPVLSDDIPLQRKKMILNGARWKDNICSFFAEGMLEVPESESRICDKHSKYYRSYTKDKTKNESEYSLIIPLKIESYEGVFPRKLNKQRCLGVLTIGVANRDILWNREEPADNVYHREIEPIVKMMEILLLQYWFAPQG